MFEMSPQLKLTVASVTRKYLNNGLLQSAPHFNQSLLKFVQIIDASLVCTRCCMTPQIL